VDVIGAGAVVPAGLVRGQQARQDRRVVVEDRVGDQPGALVGDLDVQVTVRGEFILTGELRDGRAQLVIRLDAVLQAVHEALQLRVSEVVQRVDAANQFVVFEDRLPDWIGVVGTQLADERARGHFLQPQSGDDAIDVIFFVDDARQVDLPGGFDRQSGYFFGSPAQ
jgi:hypothetical protein